MKKKIKNIEKTLEEFADKYGWSPEGLVPEEQDKEVEDTFKAKNGVAYTHMAYVLLTLLPDVTPRQFESLLEVMQDWGLLTEDGDKVKEWIYNAVWGE